ncbi:glycoside hydrolase family 25 protein [Amycolatopsis orientalis]|uniref:glycoside hydrolase family 25 protein n=1 Tax=Amycolatopsis orientalis TaxID=31958 RepID=UPI000698C22C|nr:GH25 family lysozyme [Amycolatopsis orientalis]
MPTGLGVDVHPYYQRGATFSGVEYAWIKMTDGAAVYAMKRDGRVWTADEHARRLREAGIPFGGYCYAQPGNGAAEARVLLAECDRLGGTGVAPAVDIEDNPNIYTWSTRDAVDHGRAFCAEVRRRGRRPAVYMNASKMQACRPGEWPEDPVIWVARYGRAPEASGVYRGHYDVHQFREDGNLPGSAGRVDWNQAYTLAHLTASGPGGGPTPNPNPTEDDDMITAPAGTDDHINVIVKGKGSLYLACSWGQTVDVHSILFYGDTGPGAKETGVGGGYDGGLRNPPERWTFQPNKPGPVRVPVGAAMATIRYTARHSFGIGVA